MIIVPYIPPEKDDIPIGDPGVLFAHSTVATKCLLGIALFIGFISIIFNMVVGCLICFEGDLFFSAATTITSLVLLFVWCLLQAFTPRRWWYNEQVGKGDKC